MKNTKGVNLVISMFIAINLLFTYSPDFASGFYGTLNEVIANTCETVQKNHFTEADPLQLEESNKKDDTPQSDGKIDY